MRVPKTFLAISLILFLASTVSVSSGNHIAYACSCMHPLSPDEELPKFDAVFSGKAVEVIEKHPTWPSGSGTDPVFVTLDVYSVWKGDKNETMTVKTASSSASCGFNFEENQEYIVYATEYAFGEKLEVNSCSRTGLLSNAFEEFDELGPGVSMRPETQPSDIHASPLKQFKSGIPAQEIQCNDELSLRLKHDGMPVCIKEESAVKLNERGWVTVFVDEISKLDPQKTYHSDTYSFDSFEINYTIIGADLSGIFSDTDAASLILKLENVVSDGELIIDIPKKLLDSKRTAGLSDDFFVIVDGEEVDFDEITYSYSRALTILFDDDNSQIEIITVFQF